MLPFMTPPFFKEKLSTNGAISGNKFYAVSKIFKPVQFSTYNIKFVTARKILTSQIGCKKGLPPALQAEIFKNNLRCKARNINIAVHCNTSKAKLLLYGSNRKWKITTFKTSQTISFEF